MWSAELLNSGPVIKRRLNFFLLCFVGPLYLVLLPLLIFYLYGRISVNVIPYGCLLCNMFCFC